MIKLTDSTAKDLWPKLFRYFRGRGFCCEDSEDLTQDTLVRVWSREREFESDTHVVRYVFATARSLVIKRWRRKKVEQVEIGDAPDAAPGPVEALQQCEFESALRVTLQTIPQAVGCFLDPDSEPPSYTDAARRSGIGEGALRTAVCRTRKRLRREFADLLAA